MKKVSFVLIGLLSVFQLVTQSSFAQGNLHHQSSTYEWPKDQAVAEKLEQWRDLKFGMIIHWGLYAVPGIIESWALCSESWIERDSTVAYDDFKKWYWGLSKEFNPVGFDPDQWAQAANDAGMKYVVFTTKHHDGFSMFDTKQTDFKISSGPFANHPKANVAKHVFASFRNKGFMIGAYFSKPDWHCEYYWWPKYATADRNNNYDIRRYPWRWNKYKQFTYDQIEELMTDYGRMDILWLDGGWVRPLETVNDEVRSWGAAIPEWGQDVNIPAIASMARQKQPGLLIVDRTVHGPYENYQTPEQRVPEKKLDHPWESCITLGNAWGYVPNDKFKSATEVIHTLIEITAKGGSLLLGVGPDAQGKLSALQIQRLKEIGDWLRINGEAIYNTRTHDHYQNDKTFFTRSKDGRKTYALVLMKDGEKRPDVIEWKREVAKNISKIRLISTGKAVKWKVEGDKIKVFVPVDLNSSKQQHAALAFSLEQ
jgi:alpha-L-fucosidase